MYKKLETDVYLVQKEEGLTPLECLENLRTILDLDKKIPMTYAGRIDPAAKGLLIILSGEKCKDKQKYLNFSKTYETEIIFGIETNTGDLFGEISKIENPILNESDIYKYMDNVKNREFNQKYPAFSSKTYKGKPLFYYAREKIKIPEIEHKVKITDYNIISFERIDFEQISDRAIVLANKIKGNFEPEKIIDSWKSQKSQQNANTFFLMKIEMNVSTSFYVRQFAHDLAKNLGTIAVVSSINRTKIGGYFFD